MDIYQSSYTAQDLENAIKAGSSASQAEAIVTRTITEFTSDNIDKIGVQAFTGCQKLVSISASKATYVGTAAFTACIGLKTVNLPQVTTIGRTGFQNCDLLNGVNDPSAENNVNIPAVQELNILVFDGCGSLKRAYFPVLKKMTQYEFSGTALEALCLQSATMCSLGNTNVFNNTPIASGTGYIYVPAALVDSYKAATNWSTFATQFRAIEDYTVDGTITGELDETKI